MRYKALMLDVDGTLVPYDYSSLPSNTLARSIQQAQEKIVVCFVTGRSYLFLKPVLDKLGVTKGYASVNNGAYVLDLATKKVLYDQPIPMSEARALIETLQHEKIDFYVKQGFDDDGHYPVPHEKGEALQSASMIFTDETYTEEEIDTLLSTLTGFSNLSLNKSKHSEGFGLHIAHNKATKLHGVETIISILGITKEEVIGVGDGYNDFPLLMASGLKVAMGNAVDDLKALADYVAPSVEDDGVVEIINKFILNHIPGVTNGYKI